MIFAVYGTLKQGYGNHRLLKGADYLGEFKTEPKYTLLDGGFPIVERGGEDAITVELYETEDKEVIDRVFSLEGCTKKQHDKRNWYDFDLIEFEPIGVATMFVMNKGKSGRKNIVKSGNWIKHENIF